MLEELARRPPLETLTIETGPAYFLTRDGKRRLGTAAVLVTRASIAIRYETDGDFTVEKAPYGESSGGVVAADEAWTARNANDAGKASDGTRLFSTMALTVGRANGGDVAVIRLVIAGAAWSGTGAIDGRRVIAHQLSRDTVSHHEHRMTFTIEGDLDEPAIETMSRACSFVTGIDVEILCVERYSSAGALLQVEHRRGYRRVGRGTHSPFTGVSSDDRMRAWVALVTAFPRLLKTGVPIDMIVDQIASHNQVSQIHVSATLLLMATVTAAHQRLHGDEVGPASASRRKELQRLDRDLGLGLSEEDFDRYDRLRVELLDAGFFHKPGYETGRPQVDIKFLRDLAHVIVFRLCGLFGAVLWRRAVCRPRVGRGAMSDPTSGPDWHRRADLVTAYKILVNEDILDGFGHVSVRSAKKPNIFVIPRAMPPALVTQDDLLELNVADSQPIDPKGRRVNGERYIHGEIYKVRPDVHAIIHSHSQSVIPLGLTPIKMRPVVAQAGFLPLETPVFEIRMAREPGGRGMQVTDTARGAALARVLANHPAALMRGHGDVVVGSSVKQATVHSAYVNINARMQMQALALSPDVVTMTEPELFTPDEFDINRPWEHFKQKTLDPEARAKIDRAQFGLAHTQEKK